jgi:hypothetical protein
MQGNWRNFSSRTDAHKNAPKRSLFVNYSSNDLVGVTKFLERQLAGSVCKRSSHLWLGQEGRSTDTDQPARGLSGDAGRDTGSQRCDDAGRKGEDVCILAELHAKALGEVTRGAPYRGCWLCGLRSIRPHISPPAISDVGTSRGEIQDRSPM